MSERQTVLTIHHHQGFFSVEELNSKCDKPYHIHHKAVGHLGFPFHHTVTQKANINLIHFKTLEIF